MAKIDPKNVTAQFSFRAVGNPPSTLPQDAISNFFPGLEFDLRSLWKHLFEGIGLHEAGLVNGGHQVLAVAPGSPAELAGIRPLFRLRSVDGRPVEARSLSDQGPMPERYAMEFFNSLADVVQKAGQAVPCSFVNPQTNVVVSADLVVRPVLEQVAFSRDLLEPGAMTQGLCSPWQADYRECGCYYWAASRPDFINVQVSGGVARGHNWMQRKRGSADDYRVDQPRDPEQFSYDDLYTRWEQVLTFVVGGKESERANAWYQPHIIRISICSWRRTSHMCSCPMAVACSRSTKKS
ncbi:hypothetical protein GA0061099_103112 [Bradyrhizobium yuanmingense]|uniref:Uncharacterized protein n=1 Tax=Bradyrhizobium yuanmingense TaxID=108015 RepID=A0A1C3XK41_9BRAD|nr:hypothetical protein [Bradyrhizobium yuanmingense]TWI17491.1 hypothetical protein IQ15_07423 [Bradyrhizobium yuanmingense]SCB52354.1 hypothetical protein GA0061099_103112 [Bradyrhizobium yuanmingense]